MDDPADGVGMNVEIIEDNCHVEQANVTLENPAVRYLNICQSSSSIMDESCEDINTQSKKAIVYLPYSEYCTGHEDLFLHKDEKLVKPGDKFKSHNDFIQYLNENAKRWCFYYRCSDSRKPNTEYEAYTYNCVYLRNKQKYINIGLRKRNSNMKTDCPCQIKLRQLPNEKELTVVYVCNHHDHDLSLEQFYKLQHGRRLPPYVRQEIMDLLQLKVDITKMKAYVQMETGFDMSPSFFYALQKNMKSRNIVRQITEKRLAVLKEIIAAVEEKCSLDDNDTNDQIHRMKDYGDRVAKRVKKRSIKEMEERRTSSLKRRSKPNDEVTTPHSSKRVKTQSSDATYNNETLQSVKHLQESVKCEIQTNPWVTDQTAVTPECEESVPVVENLQDDAHNEIEPYSYIIEYYDPNDASNQENISNSNECTEIIDEGQISNTIEENDVNEIAYEADVIDGINTEVPYVDNENNVQESTEMHDNANEQRQVLNDVDNEVENAVEYVTEHLEDNDDVVEFIEEVNEENAPQDIGVQTANDESSTHALMPVFDVYMKDGNVTGFVVNDNSISGLKKGEDKEIQTSEDLILSDTQDLEMDHLDFEIYENKNRKGGNTYTKHEYVHKYNIDKYMVQPYFPKYIEILAKEMSIDVLNMFTNIYNEKAMLKITTTQKGKEGNTRILYIKDAVITKRHRKDQAHRELLGRNLRNVLILKDKLRTVKKRYSELMSQNQNLEEVALRLVDMT